MATVQTVTITMVTCYKCGVPFSMPGHLSEQKRQQGESFWCPNGHKQWWGESEVDKLKRKLKNEKQSREYWVKRVHSEQEEHQTTKNSLRSHKAAKTRIINRVHKGVCPHCNRHFKNLHAHMASQHPKEVAE